MVLYQIKNCIFCLVLCLRLEHKCAKRFAVYYIYYNKEEKNMLGNMIISRSDDIIWELMKSAPGQDYLDLYSIIYMLYIPLMALFDLSNIREYKQM